MAKKGELKDRWPKASQEKQKKKAKRRTGTKNKGRGHGHKPYFKPIVGFPTSYNWINYLFYPLLICFIQKARIRELHFSGHVLDPVPL